FAVKLLALSVDARGDENVVALADALVTRDAPRASNLTTLLSGSAAERSATSALLDSLDDVRDVAGGRHTNDHADYRSVDISPSTDEVNCAVAPFLPTVGDPWLGDKAAALLDRQFRLFREDMNGPMRAALRALHAVAQRGGGAASRHLVPAFAGVKFERLEADPRPRLMVSFTLPPHHRAHALKTAAQRNEYWENAGSKMFPRDSLVALVHPGADGFQIEHFAIVATADVADLARTEGKGGAARPMVGLAFSGAGFRALAPHVLAELLRSVGRGNTGLTLVRACAGFFTYAPVLAALQRMEAVPFEEEIVHGAEPAAAEYLGELDVGAEIAAMEAKDGFAYDASQRDALHLALTRRVSLTVGPPGTGKTFLGVRIADVIHRRTTEKILCLTFTNHALDDFLTDLVAAGITSIVRCGGKCAPALEKYSMREDQRSGKRAQTFNGRRYGALKTELEECRQSLDGLRAQLDKTSIGPKWWKTLERHLRSGDAAAQAAHAMLKTPKAHDAGGFATVGEGGKKVEQDYLWKQWLKGQGRGVFAAGYAPPAGAADVWALPKAARLALKACWEDSLSSDAREDCAAAFQRYDRLKNEMQDLNRDKWRIALGEARVIGCTTTGAAKYKDLLDDCDIGVLIIEEAGEVLEAHSLTSLQRKMKHLIMIGDHRQLRPKLEHHDLTVAARQHNFNVSLFERLVVGGTRHAELAVQHRMRPAIAALIRPTYPALEDGAATRGRPHVRGLVRDVVFLDHDVPEDGCRAGASDADPAHKTNRHEVELVVETVQYLIRQNYEPKDIVVLTPYLGQLQELRKAFRAINFGTLLGELDESELEEIDGDAEAAPSAPPPVAVRCATIDNFQGEEADVIIASLVRCNPAGSIGFLCEPERV
ncbi:P-loop containing nucleoside triphosphate hydrolase protein, partial [Pelagophyceae sp. CCMP2097]